MEETASEVFVEWQLLKRTALQPGWSISQLQVISCRLNYPKQRQIVPHYTTGRALTLKSSGIELLSKSVLEARR
jgi:hypothetical protein